MHFAAYGMCYKHNIHIIYALLEWSRPFFSTETWQLMSNEMKLQAAIYSTNFTPFSKFLPLYSIIFKLLV